MLAPLFGLPAEMGVAVSLLKRAREIVLGVPALIYWQTVEGRRAFSDVEARNGEPRFAERMSRSSGPAKAASAASLGERPGANLHE